MDIVVEEEKLSVRSEEVDVRKDNKLLRKTILDLKKAIKEHNLISLSAIQIGVAKRIFVINFNGDLRTFINPIITQVKGFELSKETCASIPEKRFIRPRHNDITVVYQTPLGKIESRKIFGMSATVFQHSVDHLDGLLISDIGLEIDKNFEQASEDEQQEVIKMYLDSLDIKQKEISAIVQENKDLKQMAEAIDFIEKVQKGEIKATTKKYKKEEIPDNGKCDNSTKEE